MEESQAITRGTKALTIIIQQGRPPNSHFICLVLSLGGSKVMDEGVVALRVPPRAGEDNLLPAQLVSLPSTVLLCYC